MWGGAWELTDVGEPGIFDGQGGFEAWLRGSGAQGVVKSSWGQAQGFEGLGCLLLFTQMDKTEQDESTADRILTFDQ